MIKWIKLLVVLVGLLAASPAWSSFYTSTVFDSTTDVEPGVQFYTNSIDVRDVNSVVFQVVSSDTCTFCAVDEVVLEQSWDNNNWTPADTLTGFNFHGTLDATMSLDRFSTGGGKTLIITPSLGLKTFPVRYTRLAMLSSNYLGYTNRYRINAYIYK